MERSRDAGAGGGSGLAGRRETFLLSAAVFAAFAVPAFLYLYPLDPRTQFLPLWRAGALAAGAAGAAVAAASFRRRHLRPGGGFPALAAAMAAVAVLGGAGTMAVTARLAPPPQERMAAVPAKGGITQGQPASAGKPGGAAPGKGGQTLASAGEKTAAAAPVGSGQGGGEAAKPLPVKAPEEMSAGEKLVRDRCLGCHRLQGYGFGVKDDLDEAGKAHTMSWFVQMLRDPVNVGLKRAKGLHPALADDEVKEVARFLAGRGGSKGEEKPWFGDQKTDLSAVDLVEFGKRAWDRLNCQACHKINGQGHGFMGPALSQEGARRDAAWIEHFLTHYLEENSPMPFIPITADEIRGLAAYLASLR